MDHKRLCSSFVAHGLLVLAIPLGCDRGEAFRPDVGAGVALETAAEDQGAAVACAGSSMDGTLAPATGVPPLDGFFEAVAQLQAAADQVHARANQAVGDMAYGVGVSIDSSGSVPAQAQAVVAYLQERARGRIEEGLGVMHPSVSCVVATDALVDAAASCEGESAPAAPVVAMCEGSCWLDAGAGLACEATLRCEGQAPELRCAGECTGSCVEPDTLGSCEGTCDGLCTGTCDGGPPGISLECYGECSGTCSGSCETSLLGEHCDGQCLGSCVWEATEGVCGAAASPVCVAEGWSAIECVGTCAGALGAEGLSAECMASAIALANETVECARPELIVDPRFVDGVDASTREELAGVAEGLVPPYGELLVSGAEAQHRLDTTFATGGLPEAVVVLQGLTRALIDSDPDGATSAELACALEQLERAPEILESIQWELEAVAIASGTISGSVAASVR